MHVAPPQSVHHVRKLTSAPKKEAIPAVIAVQKRDATNSKLAKASPEKKPCVPAPNDIFPFSFFFPANQTLSQGSPLLAGFRAGGLGGLLLTS